MGRISLNPLRHVDLVGTLLVPALILLVSAGGLLFGWAKPVTGQVSTTCTVPSRTCSGSLPPGRVPNLLMALFWALMLKLAISSPDMMYSEALKEMARVGISINGALMVLNLLPLPPLDGGRIAVSLLPPRAAWKFAQLERWGFPILLAMLFLGLLDTILRPLLRVFNTLIRTLFGF